jgi:hypothetical protein
MPTWLQITTHPGNAVVQVLRQHWRWWLGERWTPLMFSALGDVLVQVAAGSVWWLSTATGGLEQVADSREQFVDQLRGERQDEWFLPGLIDVLRAQGKVLEPDPCYSFAVFPVFAGGSFSAENMHVKMAADHFALTGQLHESIRQLPDGARVRFTISD